MGERRVVAEAALFEQVSRVTRLETVVDSLFKTRSQHEQQLESSFRQQLETKFLYDLQELQLAEAERQKEAMSVLELCRRAERELRENGAKLQIEIAGNAEHSLQKAAVVASQVASAEGAERERVKQKQGISPATRISEDRRCDAVDLSLDAAAAVCSKLQRAVDKLASSQSDLLQAVKAQASRMASVEQKVDEALEESSLLRKVMKAKRIECGAI